MLSCSRIRKGNGRGDMTTRIDFYDELGREAGCRRLAVGFYARVAENSTLRPLFPGKSLRCATEEFAAFLVQLFDGNEGATQYRWWLSLRESHGRFRISDEQRSAWLMLMAEAVHEVVADGPTCGALADFFARASLYVVRGEASSPIHPELAARWERQVALDRLIENLAAGRDGAVLSEAGAFVSWKCVYPGVLAKMMETGREALVDFVVSSLRQDPTLVQSRFNGRSLLHLAASSGSLAVVEHLLANGADANVLDRGGHAPLYRAAGNARIGQPREVVEALVRAGAAIDHAGGPSRSTALHEAARHGSRAVAELLLELGADQTRRDRRGLTAFERAVGCRRPALAELLRPDS